MNKQEILSEIRRIAQESGGKAPGFQKFSSETGARKSDWYPNLWLRWGDAIKEAGYDSNVFVTAFDEDYLISKYIELIREIGHLPIEGELTLKKKEDPDFPARSTFAQLGSKYERVQKIIEYCSGKEGFDDIVSHCEIVQTPNREKSESHDFDSVTVGYVYLIKHGSRNEYKIGMTNNPIRREGELRIELPEKVQPVHYIETDDPVGIEKYWHSRFSDKRKEGEWFCLSAKDVRAFKRWRRIY